MSEPIRPDDLRVSDAERTRVQQHLTRAHDAGQLDLGEFDERVQSVWAAKTRGELARVVADLPAPPAPPPAAPRPTVFSDTGGGVAMRVLTIVFGSIAAVNLVIWAIVSVSTGQVVYPWWLFVAGPPAAVLGVLYASGIGRPPRR